MLLVDNDVKVFLNNGRLEESQQTAIRYGNESSITNIGYDLCSKKFYKTTQAGDDSCVLLPGESAFVESYEFIEFDSSTVGIVSLKNSRIRMGLSLDSPIYQPGHKTPIRFRLTNITDKTIYLSQGEKYAMLMFYQLEQPPEQPYNGTYQKEFSFSGMGEKYNSAYAKQIEEIDNKVKDIKSIEKDLYTNVITILTIFIGIFTLLNVNISLTQTSASIKNFFAFNLAAIGSISFLSCLLNELLQKEKANRWLWILPAVVFFTLFILLFI